MIFTIFTAHYYQSTSCGAYYHEFHLPVPLKCSQMAATGDPRLKFAAGADRLSFIIVVNMLPLLFRKIPFVDRRIISCFVSACRQGTHYGNTCLF